MNSRIQFNFVPLCGLALVLALGGCGESKSPSGNSNGGAQLLVGTVSNKIAAIAAKGDPVTLEELNKSYAEPPAGQNAAELYAQAFNALTDEDPKVPNFLAHNQKAVALLLQAA